MKAFLVMKFTWILLSFAAWMCGRSSNGAFVLHGGNVRSGRLWAEYGQVYYPVCSSQKWRFNEAQFACRSLQLGATSLNAKLLSNSDSIANLSLVPGRPGEKFSTAKLLQLECWPHPTCDSPQYDVTENCDSGKQVVLNCFDRHVPSRYQATLHPTTRNISYGVEMWYNGRYFPVCASSWSANETRVACRELFARGALLHAGPTTRTPQRPRSLNFSYVTSSVEGLACTGSERWLSECYHRGRGWVEHKCRAMDVVNFACQRQAESRGLGDDSPSTTTAESTENKRVPWLTFYLGMAGAAFVIILLAITTGIGCCYRAKYIDLKRTGRFSLSALERMNNAGDKGGETGRAPSYVIEPDRRPAGELQSSLRSLTPPNEQQETQAAPTGSRELASPASARSRTPTTTWVRRPPPPPPIAASQHGSEYSAPVVRVREFPLTSVSSDGYYRRPVGMRYVNAAACRSTLPPVEGACSSDYIIDHVNVVSFPSDPDYLSMHNGHTGTRV